MKPMIAWMKSNIAIVALSAVIVITLPAAYIGSAMWNKRIRTSREAEATKAMTDLGALRVTYTIPSALPGGEPITLPANAPNPRLTEYFREHREKLEEQVAQIVVTAQEVNSRGHKPLVDGVFPIPESRVKTLELAEALVGKGDRPSAYEKLFKSLDAGGPAEPLNLEMALQEHRDRTRERIEAETGRTQLTKEEEAELATELASLRLGYYQQHAQRLSFYVSPDVLPREVPTTVTSPPSVEESFRWQFDYWTIADLLHAVQSANTVDGTHSGVERAVVKHVESITLEPLVRQQRQDETAGGFGEQPRAPRNPITGRASNELYDVRNATMSLIVASERLPQLIDAIARTNFITVIGLDFEEIDPWSQLEQGYFYGSEHVVRAKVRLETVWLRNWTLPLMPPKIRLALTGSEDLPDEGGAG